LLKDIRKDKRLDYVCFEDNNNSKKRKKKQDRKSFISNDLLIEI